MARRESMLTAGLLTCLLGASATNAQAQTGPYLILTPWEDGAHVEADGYTSIQQNTHANDSNKGVQVIYSQSDMRARLDPKDRLSPAVGHSLTLLNLDTSDPRLPHQLMDESVAVGWNFLNLGDWALGGTIGGGYAGANAYGDTNAVYAKGSLMATHAFSTKTQLTFLVDYNGNRGFMPDVPLPGIELTHQLSDTLQLVAGLPYNRIQWHPVEPLTLSASFILISGYDLEVAYEFLPSLKVFAQAGNSLDAFWMEHGEERLFFQRHHVESGLTWEPCQHVELLAAIGYAFSQDFSRGFDVRDLDTITTLSDAPYLRAGLSLAF